MRSGSPGCSRRERRPRSELMKRVLRLLPPYCYSFCRLLDWLKPPQIKNPRHVNKAQPAKLAAEASRQRGLAREYKRVLAFSTKAAQEERKTYESIVYVDNDHSVPLNRFD